MAPIRVGFIGLSTASDRTSTGAWGANAHLPSLLSSPHYEIVALCNSTVASANRSIAHHNLGPNVKAYGNPNDLAADPDIDLVLCSVEILRHYELLKPAVLAGKDIYVEWPLAATISQAEELTALAKEKGIKTIVGAQKRSDPLLVKIKQLIDSGKIGKVLSTSVTGTITLPPVLPEAASYYHLLESGGNVLTIWIGHFLDSFVHVLGNFGSLTSILKSDSDTAVVKRSDGSIGKVPKNTPDQVLIQGTLISGAVASLNYRTAPAGSVGGVGVHWIITGTEGEIDVKTQELMWQVDFGGSVLKLKTKDGLEDVDFSVKEEEWISGLSIPAHNTARSWEAFAKGDQGRFVDFEGALEEQKLLDAIRVGHL